MRILAIFKRPFCKHKKYKYTGKTYVDETETGKMMTHHIHRCVNCGKELHH